MGIRLAIVDDEARLSTSLRGDLMEFSEIESVVTSSSGLAFAKDLESMPPSFLPEIIIMDIHMGVSDEGIQATRIIKNNFPQIGIVMFTNSDDDDRVFEAFKAGAMGYLLKNEQPSFILKTILDVKMGGAQMSPSIARKTIEFLVPKPRESEAPPSEVDNILSPREIEILQQVAKGNTYQEIGSHFFISPNTVKKHMVHIYSKLQVKNKIEALKKTERLPR